MEPGKYLVKNIDKGKAVLEAIEGSRSQYTFPAEEFEHHITVGDVVEVWKENGTWRTMYLEEDTKSPTSHTKDFLNRIFEQE